MSDHIIRMDQGTYILATSAPSSDQSRTLKDADTFALLDHYGDLPKGEGSAYGFYHECTRFFSLWELRLADARPFLLNSSVVRDNSLLTVHLTNPDFQRDGRLLLPRGTLHILRSVFVHEKTIHEKLALHNYGEKSVEIPLRIRFGADFADIFEIRGTLRKEHGDLLEPVLEAERVKLSYRGRDGLVRCAVVECPHPQARWTKDKLEIPIQISASAHQDIFISIAYESNKEKHPTVSYPKAYESMTQNVERNRRADCLVTTGNDQFNAWMERSQSDLHMLFTQTPWGAYPYAGIPWYNTVFGRDGILTAMQLSWMNSSISKAVLGYLASQQASERDELSGAEPGKILHELREGEMARLKEVPFAKVYSSVDATPLFIILAGMYARQTGNWAFIESLWPNIQSAVEWMSTSGDKDGDGFLEYDCNREGGLLNQGWKDSHDSVSHADGSFPIGPIALCEVQAYAYAAYRSAAWMAQRLAKESVSVQWSRHASDLKSNFEQAFWSEEIGGYALALDGQKKQCRVATSNMGHLLFTEILSAEKAALVKNRLLEPDMFSAWGIRTLSQKEKRYNPMSYHNGSVWPHDNGFIAAGMCHYGFKEEAGKILGALFEASSYFELNRLPELYCGFPRLPGEGPTLYPVACNPQAWASGTIFMLLGALLGLNICEEEKQIRISHPYLPAFLPRVRIQRLRVGDSVVDLEFIRHLHDVGVNVLEKKGKVGIVTVK